MENQKQYDSSSIQVLEGLEAVRKRPGMYIGNIDVKGLHHLIWEIVDNSVDEALAGHADTIKITFHKDQSFTIEDNGRGIPVEKHHQTGKSTVETVFQVLHAGGKFGGENSGYKVSGGLHGVGASVVNALSEYVDVHVKRNGKVYHVKFYEGGKHSTGINEIGTYSDGRTGTKVNFKADFGIFNPGVKFDFEIVKARLKQTAYLNRGLHIVLHNENDGEHLDYQFEGGIVDYVLDINKYIDKVNPQVVYNNGKQQGVEVEIAMQYTTATQPNILSFVNNVSTVEGGTHVAGFLDAVLRIINNFADRVLPAKEKQKFERGDIQDGLVAIVAIRHPDPMYEGQTKGKLANAEVRKIVNEVVSKEFEKVMIENPSIATQIMMKIQLAAKSRIAAEKAKEMVRKKESLDFATLPGKLADCSSNDKTKTELFIVEGDSAGGSAKMGRNREYQAILPLRGKVINAEKARLDKLFQNNEISSLVTAIGAGIAEEFNIARLRYGKIIIMTDADVDGSHIRTLLLTFFYRYLKPLIEAGHVYIAQPPLYKVTKGNTERYIYSDFEKEEFLKSIDKGTKFSIQRYKGLGEMNDTQLWETTMDPDNRKMLKVTIEDSLVADQIFSSLMGELVEPRREFIIKNSKFAKLDL